MSSRAGGKNFFTIHALFIKKIIVFYDFFLAVELLFVTKSWWNTKIRTAWRRRWVFANLWHSLKDLELGFHRNFKRVRKENSEKISNSKGKAHYKNTFMDHSQLEDWIYKECFTEHSDHFVKKPNAPADTFTLCSIKQKNCF
jgi:hypothetical protein